MKIPDAQLTDEQIALLVQQGDKEKFGFLMDRYERKLFRYGQKFLFDHHNIEDLIQEIFLKAYQNIKSFDISQKFSPWIYRIAHNSFINAIKKTSRSPLSFFDFDTLIPHPEHVDEVAQEHDRKAMRKIIDQGLQKLSPNYREIIILFYLEDLSYKEIGDILHVPPGTVGIRLQRAKQQLKKNLPAEAHLHL